MSKVSRLVPISARLLMAGAVLLPTVALAHPGHGVGHPAGEPLQVLASFWAGLAHPIAGLDHLLAMLAVGLWSALVVRRFWLPPLVFLLAMCVGAMLGLAHVPVPAIEPMIAASLLVLGLALAFAARVSETLVMWVVAGFAVFHGVAHGAEMPAGASALAYLAGFGVATLALHATGVLAGVSMRERRTWLARLGGTGVACYGVTLLVV